MASPFPKLINRRTRPDLFADTPLAPKPVPAPAVGAPRPPPAARRIAPTPSPMRAMAARPGEAERAAPERKGRPVWNGIEQWVALWPMTQAEWKLLWPGDSAPAFPTGAGVTRPPPYPPRGEEKRHYIFTETVPRDRAEEHRWAAEDRAYEASWYDAHPDVLRPTPPAQKSRGPQVVAAPAPAEVDAEAFTPAPVEDDDATVLTKPISAPTRHEPYVVTPTLPAHRLPKPPRPTAPVRARLLGPPPPLRGRDGPPIEPKPVSLPAPPGRRAVPGFVPKVTQAPPVGLPLAAGSDDIPF